MLDGYDISAISASAPLLLKAWHVDNSGVFWGIVWTIPTLVGFLAAPMLAIFYRSSFKGLGLRESLVVNQAQPAK